MMRLITVTLARVTEPLSLRSRDAILILCSFLFSATAVFAQGTILQGGPWAPGHAPMYTGQGSGQAVVQDSGPAGGGATGYGLSEQLLVARGTGTPPYAGQGTGPFGTNWCDYDAPITNPTGYHFLCFSPNTTAGGIQGGQLIYGSGGTAIPLPFDVCVNGSCAPINGGLGSLIIGTTPIASGTSGFELYNNAGVLGNRTQSAALDGACATNNYDLLRISGTWQCGVLNAPVGGLPLFAAPTATGTGTCLSSGNACTLATACQFVSQVATFLGTVGPINLAHGTYSAPDGNGNLCTIQGNSGGSSSQLVSINGDIGSPTSVILSIAAADSSHSGNGIVIQDGGEAGVNNLEITAASGGTGIFCRQLAICDYSNIYWGSWGGSGSHVSVNGGASSNMTSGGETILANFNYHWNISAGGYFVAAGTTHIPSAVTWTQFAQSISSNIDLSAWAHSGSGDAGSSGPTFFGVGPGRLLLASNASCSSQMPGSTGNCQFQQGYQDSFGDGMTGIGILVGQQAPTIADPTLAAHTYAGLPASPTAGQISHIVDGLAANCGDGTCTTPGTTVTGGSGALDLLVGYDGAAWRIFRAAGPSSIVVAKTGIVSPGSAGCILYNNAASSGTVSCESTAILDNAGNLAVAALTVSSPVTVPNGGTGHATAAAHSIPISEGASAQNAVGPCATNQVIVGGGASADPTCGTNVAGAMVNLATLTASNSASLSDTTHITNTYTSYLLVFQNIVPATNEKILQLQIHSGGAFKATGYLSNNTVLISNTSSGGTSTTYIPISLPADANAASLANAAPGFSGNAIITTPSANALCMIYVNGGYLNGNGSLTNSASSGYWNTAGVVDGFQVLMDSGNITSGSIIIYGIQ